MPQKGAVGDDVGVYVALTSRPLTQSGVTLKFPTEKSVPLRCGFSSKFPTICFPPNASSNLLQRTGGDHLGGRAQLG